MVSIVPYDLRGPDSSGSELRCGLKNICLEKAVPPFLPHHPGPKSSKAKPAMKRYGAIANTIGQPRCRKRDVERPFEATRITISARSCCEPGAGRPCLPMRGLLAVGFIVTQTGPGSARVSELKTTARCSQSLWPAPK